MQGGRWKASIPAHLRPNPAGTIKKTMAFEVEGTLKVIMDTQTFGSGFTKREFVVTVGDDRYP